MGGTWGGHTDALAVDRRLIIIMICPFPKVLCIEISCDAPSVGKVEEVEKADRFTSRCLPGPLKDVLRCGYRMRYVTTKVRCC